MRITHNVLSETVLAGLNATLERLDRLQEQVTSGKRFTRPSHDPAGVARSLDYRTALAATEQYLRNADSALAWLQATDIALGGAGEVFQRARELGVRAASDAMSANDRQAIAAELEQLLAQLLELSNARYDDQYLFAGLKTTTQPFTTAGGPYQGDSGQVLRELGPNSAIAVNVPGQPVFSDAFAMLSGLRSAVLSNDGVAISSALGALDTAHTNMLAARARVGAKMNRLESTTQQLQEQLTNLKQLLSQVEDADMAETLVLYNEQQNVYRAALGAGARAIQPSLLDYLR